MRVIMQQGLRRMQGLPTEVTWGMEGVKSMDEEDV